MNAQFSNHNLENPRSPHTTNFTVALNRFGLTRVFKLSVINIAVCRMGAYGLSSVMTLR